MTALDQAFVKAFTRQDTSPLPVSPRALKQPPRTPSPSAASAANPTRCVPLSATLDGVWAALERPPRTQPGIAHAENPSDDPEQANVSPYCSIVESAFCSPFEPSAPYFTTTTIEPASTVEQKTSHLPRETAAKPAPVSQVAPAVSAVSAPSIAPAVLATPTPSVLLRAGNKTQTDALPTAISTVESCDTKAQNASSDAIFKGFAPVGEELVPIFSQPRNVQPDAAPIPAVSLPVSTVLQVPPAPREFKPGWQVDHFTWPKVCRRLIARAADELDRLADALLAANAQGHKVLAIGGCRRGEGATTLLLCAARRLAERGIKPVLVDADLGRPRLAKRLCLQPQFGWDETSDVAGKSIEQAIVEATTNNVALLPAREPQIEGGRPVGDPSRLPDCLETLRNHYDMVLVDLGPLEDTGLDDPIGTKAIARMVDAVVLVHNDRMTSEERLTALVERLAAAGITTAGIVENFVIED